MTVWGAGEDFRNIDDLLGRQGPTSVIPESLPNSLCLCRLVVKVPSWFVGSFWFGFSLFLSALEPPSFTAFSRALGSCQVLVDLTIALGPSGAARHQLGQDERQELGFLGVLL